MSREQQEYWDIQAWRHETEYFARIEEPLPTFTHLGGKHYKSKDRPF